MQNIFSKFFQAIMIVIVSFIALPAFAAYKTPSDITGISEKTYTALKNARCDYESTVRCGSLIDQLAGKVVMRTEHNGEMYIVSEPFDLPLIKRFLPNGFYAIKQGDNKTYYLLIDGYKIFMTGKNAFQRLLDIAKNDGVIPVSENDYGSLMMQCEYYPDTNPNYTLVEYQTCIKKYDVGQELFRRLEGRLIMRVEKAGELYYVDPTSDPSPSAILPINEPIIGGDHSFFFYMKQRAMSEKISLMRSILLGNDKFLK